MNTPNYFEKLYLTQDSIDQSYHTKINEGYIKDPLL